MGIFVSVPKTIECILIAVAMGILLMPASYKMLGILQNGGYSERKLLRWAVRRGNMTLERLALLSLLSGLGYGVLASCFSFCGTKAALIGTLIYPVLFALYAVSDRKVALRCPAVPTPRFKRLAVVTALVTTLFAYLLAALANFCDQLWANEWFSVFRYAVLCLLPLLLLPLVCLSSLLTKLYETPHNKRYIEHAKRKLAASSLTVVGITGSYGKTSVKAVLEKMLSAKFRVLATPRSYNTPIGIAVTVNKNDLSRYDIFLAEMGARNVGDIAELCTVCPPDYALVTGICPQHLETFFSVPNVVKAKGEILTAARKKTLIASDCFGYFKDYDVDKVACRCVSDVLPDCEGTTFTLTLGGRSRTVRTRLLGKHAAFNIGLAAQLAFELGETLDEIADVIPDIPYVKHRLELIRSKGVNILDDGYNANIRGASAAVKVLKSFPGRKFVVTPGLVELGILEEKENAALGRQLVGLDRILLVGDSLVTLVKEGYLQNGGDVDRLSVVPTLAAAQEQLKSELRQGDTVLFLNDLPDVY